MNECGLLLDPLQWSTGMTYLFLKAYWNAFIVSLRTKSIRKCQSMLPNLKILFAYGPITGKRPVFAHVHDIHTLMIL